MEMNDNETVGLKPIIVKYLHHWKLFLAMFVLSAIPAILYLALYPRTYEMMARVQLQEDKDVGGGSFGLGEAAGLMKSFGLGGATAGALNVEDEVRNMLSNSLLSKVVLDLGVNVEYTEPFSFFRIYDAPIVVSTDSLTNERLNEDIEIKFRVDGQKFKVQTKSVRTGKHSFEFASLPGEITLPTGVFVVGYAPGKSQSDLIHKLNIVYHPAGWVAEDIEKDFLIEEASKTSLMVELSCTDHEKQRGLDLLNTIVAHYNDRSYDFKKKDADKTLRFLDARIDSITRSLHVVENHIAAYKFDHKLTDVEHDVQFYIEQMKELQVKLIELEAQGNLLRMMNDFVDDPANRYNLVPGLFSSQEGEKASPIMAYNEVLLERARVIQNSSMSNPLVTTLSEQADQLRGSVFASISNAQKSLQMSIDDVRGREKSIYDMMGSFPEQERDYIEMKRQQEIYQGVYLILLQKREETALNGGLDKKKARIIDAAYVKSQPVGPRKLYAAIGMLVFTLVVSVGYIFGKEQFVGLVDEYRKYKQ